jgi:hypothetical protein
MNMSTEAKYNKRKRFLADQSLITTNDFHITGNVYKKNKVTISKECSYKSSLLVKWNYENPCDQ